MSSSARLRLGKLPPEILERYLLGMTGASSKELVVAPSLGVDFGVVRHGDASLIVSSDPVTGVKGRVGWYAVNVSANDIATSGNRPQFLQSIILLPEGSRVGDVAAMASEMHKTASELGITIVGGHTELTPGLKRPIVITTAFAFASSYVTAAGARDGDSIMITKTAGVEGTAICATESRLVAKKMGPRATAEARRYIEKMSVVDEAVSAYATGAVHAMHDCTEGGVLGAVYEMSRAAGVGFELREGDIPVGKETSEVCSMLQLDPLRLISSGTLLISVEKGRERDVSKAVAEAGSRATVVGAFRKGRRTLVHKDGGSEEVADAPTDELWKLIGNRRI
jgi:hydrogenase expression/formation protein HypE